jgi:hypothetical protein
MHRELRVHVAEDGADTERLGLLAGYLRADLLELDVDDVGTLRTGAAPEGSRAIDAIAAGGLLVGTGETADSLRAIVSAISAGLNPSTKSVGSVLFRTEAPCQSWSISTWVLNACVVALSVDGCIVVVAPRPDEGVGDG